MIKVHGVHGSPYVRKVFIALDIKDIPYEIVRQMPFFEDSEYLKINPLGKVPSLVAGGLTLCDSKVICQYLDDAYPEPRLYPIRPNDWARALWYEDLAGGRISELAASIFFQRFIRPLAFKLEPDEELITRIVETDLPPMLDYLESQIPMGRFIFDDFMMADLSITSPFINAAYAGYQVDESRWPNLAGLIARVRAQPQVVAVLEKEKRVLGLD